MGMLSYFYSDFPLVDKKHIARDLYNTSYKNVDSWLRCITDLRNKCAHYSRLYYWKFPAQPVIPKSFDFVPSGRLFDQILMLKFLYIDKSKWNKSIVIEIQALIEEYFEHIKLSHIGFPDNWKDLLVSPY
ncbi:hypothetical protein N752_19430 [Desulforamulus aquiferis]|nr:hypothetical protein N752_19430 [Desulforamulus aquiferis]